MESTRGSSGCTTSPAVERRGSPAIPTTQHIRYLDMEIMSVGRNWNLPKKGLGFLATVIGVFCYSGLVYGVFCNGATWGGFFATVPRGFFATVPACRGFFATVPRGFFATVPACRGFFASVFTSRQGNFKTTKITAGKLCFFGISSYS